jgi:hypothetical protein
LGPDYPFYPALSVIYLGPAMASGSLCTEVLRVWWNGKTIEFDR